MSNDPNTIHIGWVILGGLSIIFIVGGSIASLFNYHDDLGAICLVIGLGCLSRVMYIAEKFTKDTIE